MIVLFALLTVVPILNITHRDTLFQGDTDTLRVVATDSSGVALDSIRIELAFGAPGIVETADTVMYTDTAGSVYTEIIARNPGYTDIYVTAIDSQDTAVDTTGVLVLDSTLYFYISVYPARMTISSDETDTVYARLYSRDSAVAGRLVRFSVVRGSGYVSPLTNNTDVNGIAYTVFHPNIGDTVFVEGYYEDHTGRKIADTTRIIVETSSADTQRAFADSLFFYPSPIGHGHERASIEYLLPRNFTDVEIRILDPFGNTVFLKRINPGEEGGISDAWNRIFWNGRNSNGKKVASGMYILVVRIYRGTALLRELSKRVGVEW